MKQVNLKFTALIFLGILLIAGTALANGADRYARIRYVEGDVALYPSDGQRPSDATINSPVLDGDEMETQNGRAEISFRNGIVVRLADYSAVRIESTYSPMTMELLNGTMFVDSHMVDRFRDELEVRAGGAQIYLINEGNLRVDLGSKGTVRVTTLDGKAEVRAGGTRVLLDPQERTYIDPGREPEQPEQFAQNYDELDDWNQSRMDAYADNGMNSNNGYVDNSIYYDSQDLNAYGDWQNYGDYGNVWVPRVYAGWRPYYDGRWLYANDSWFWASYEPWGWAPYHYGSWNWAFGIGWFWVPGAVFAPAWVSWYDYGDYIGWCPTNYYGYPVYYNGYYDGYHDGHYGYPPVQKQKTIGAGDSWTFVKKASLGDSSIKRISTPASEIKSLRIEKNQVLAQPGKNMVPFVAGKGAKPAHTSPTFKTQSATPTNSWDDSDSPAKQGWNDRDSRKTGTYSSGSSGKQTFGTSGGTSQKSISTSGKSTSGSSTSGSSGSSIKSAPPSSSSKSSGSSSSKSSGATSSKSSGSSSDKKPQPPNFNRDEQFERYMPSQKSSGSRLYYDSRSLNDRTGQFREWNESSRGYATRDDASKSYRYDNPRNTGDGLIGSWFRDNRSYQEPNPGNEVSPRYMDGAKRIFEGYEASRNSGSTRDYGRPDYGRSTVSRDSGKYGSSSPRMNSGSSGFSGAKSYGSAPSRSAPSSGSSGATSAKKPH